MSRTSLEIEVLSTISQFPKKKEASSSIARPAALFGDAINRTGGDSRSELGNAAHVEANGKTVLVVAAVTLVTGTSSMLNGLVTVSLPTLAVDLDLATELLLW